MKLLVKAAVIAAALSASAAANAAMFDFSYTFTDGQKVNGSLDGTLNGTTISDISNLQVSLDGIAFTGGSDANGATSLKLYGFDAANGSYDGTATFSTVSSHNNFAIADEDPSTNPNYFFSFLGDPSLGGPLIGAGNFLQGNGAGGFQAAGDTVDSGTWNVAPVPLPAALPLLLSGLGVFGFAKRRRAV